jgi:ribosomal protein S18 acetylase RimI-like enzyme
MQRAIVGFHQDDEQHWVAELECGHNQHVRHDPPWFNRPWTTTPEGLAKTLGKRLECRKCDGATPRDGVQDLNSEWPNPMPIKQLLDNITWHALVGPHAKYAVGMQGARRYAQGFSPIVGFAEPAQPDFAALAPFCEAGEHFYCEGWAGVAPAGWRIDSETSMFKLLWEAGMPATDEAPDAIALGREHASQALELATLTRPGPFGFRTVELGEYFGYFSGQRLVAMAGERMHAATLREISGVCTHPDFQGRGLARQLMLKLVRRQMQRCETPFLHVMRENTGALRLYERLGFRSYRETVVRVISRLP